jgi:hypothetical protein
MWDGAKIKRADWASGKWTNGKWTLVEYQIMNNSNESSLIKSIYHS